MTLSELIRRNQSPAIPALRPGNLARSMLSLQDDMDRMFEEVWGGASLPSLAQTVNFPAIDVTENEKTFKVKAEVAGMRPEDIDISITEGAITLKGEKKEEKEETGENYIRRESSFGAFERRIALPEAANADHAEATFKNGVLCVEIPKKAEAVRKPKKLNIKKVS